MENDGSPRRKASVDLEAQWQELRSRVVTIDGVVADNGDFDTVQKIRCQLQLQPISVRQVVLAEVLQIEDQIFRYLFENPVYMDVWHDLVEALNRARQESTSLDTSHIGEMTTAAA